MLDFLGSKNLLFPRDQPSFTTEFSLLIVLALKKGFHFVVVGEMNPGPSSLSERGLFFLFRAVLAFL